MKIDNYEEKNNYEEQLTMQINWCNTTMQINRARALVHSKAAKGHAKGTAADSSPTVRKLNTDTTEETRSLGRPVNVKGKIQSSP